MVTTRPLDELQAQIQAWADRYWQGTYWPPLANLARLTEEAGEVARAINQIYGPKQVKDSETAAELQEELETCSSSCSAWPTARRPTCRQVLKGRLQSTGCGMRAAYNGHSENNNSGPA